MSRFNSNESRRNIFIPEFGSYLVLSNYIKKENIIQELIDFCESEHVSFSPILSNDDTIMQHEEEYKKCSFSMSSSVSPIYLKYKKLDELIRKQNLNQTNGLLVGTQYSKIISEGILTRIDIELKAKNINYSRYVDDYEVYLYEDNEKQIISAFDEILKKYGFSLNHEKTEIIDFPYYKVFTKNY